VIAAGISVPIGKTVSFSAGNPLASSFVRTLSETQTNRRASAISAGRRRAKRPAGKPAR
jgi:hypothetical protein